MTEPLTKRQEAVYECIRAFIEEKGYGPTVRDICNRMGLSSPSTVHVHLNALEEKGFVARTTNPDSARGKLIVLTEKADSMQEELVKLGDTVEDKLTERLTLDERAQLIDLLQRLLGLES